MRALRLGLALGLLAWTAAAQSRGRGARCKESCSRHLTDSTLRASICGRCLTDGTNDRGSWALALKDHAPRQDVIDGILKDPDWQVRWGAVRANAAVRGFSEMRELSTWIVDGRDALPCLTALHVAGTRKQTTGAMLQVGGTMGPSAAALCWQKREELRKALELEMYSTDTVIRREAMVHLAAFFELTPARVVLNAMATRAPATDEAAATLLVEEANAGGPPAGAALLKVAKQTDAPRVDRLLAIWAVTLDAQRPKLKAGPPGDRKDAIAALSAIGPLGAAELETLLEDPDVSIRLAAARAIARGEGLTLGAYGKRKMDPKEKIPTKSRVRWAEFLGRTESEDCAQTLRAAIADVRLDEPVRAAAVAALGGCAGAAALPEVKKALASKSPRQRAAALDALAQIPRVPEAAGLVGEALRDLEPEVLTAAVSSVAAHRLTSKIPEVLVLLEHAAPEVRIASARTLVLIGDSRAAPALGRALQKDMEADVREACARGLGELGGPDAPGPLTHAAEKDVSSRVKYVAGESLRKLGFNRGAVKP